MAKYTKDKRELIFVRVGEDQKRKLAELSAKEERPISYFVRKAVDAYIAQFDARSPQVER